ncbi:hypothetical protein HBHAL_1719 [Halobacillus halophilus DSM 2266]|uniref:Uncharacterized protein n=1 Tax=Halobacillus halophilus (strain ATCC 35676 / DSM 2266 / JCM 20832 / KCTC 3685 / LMG 17431 / NBRC 102448 / NCIMB 2269) TaxID=866895 RepID=I0JIW7_HALH3|nr:hypothetical protein HBHAL_1719 [Halobacillus halophilus DSM 2266]
MNKDNFVIASEGIVLPLEEVPVRLFQRDGRQSKDQNDA